MRKSDFSQELADLICERLATGESLRKICLDEQMPAASTVWLWLDKNQAFSEQYARAREAQAEYYADEIVDISDEAIDNETAASARVRVDARKWVASKLRPRKYGELVKHEHGGSNGGPIPVSIAVSYAKPDNSG